MDTIKLDIQLFAGIGLKRFRWAPLNENGLSYGIPKSLEGAIESKVALNVASSKLYGDDVLQEQEDKFIDGTMTIGVTDDPDDIFAELLGKTVKAVSNSELQKEYRSNVSNKAPYVGFGHVVPKIVKGKRVYKVEFFPKVKFKPFVVDKSTKNDTLTFTTPSVEGTICENIEGDWLVQSTFEKETEANDYLDSLFIQEA